MSKNKIALSFIKSILQHKKILEMKNHEDQEVKLTAHTYDVLKIAYEEIRRDYPNFKEGRERVNYFEVIVGIIVHDVSKGSIRHTGEVLSHSQMMLKRPEYIMKETEDILSDIENKIGFRINDKSKNNIIHIVVSHHGKWGKIQPNTKEAHIVHRADVYSAKYHRINPIGADKILRFLDLGMNIDEIAKKFNCTTGVIKDRLKRAKDELRLKTTKQLLGYYKNKKKIPIGDAFFTKRVRETEKLLKSVEKFGFESLILEIPLLNYLEDAKIFIIEEKNEGTS